MISKCHHYLLVILTTVTNAKAFLYKSQYYSQSSFLFQQRHKAIFKFHASLTPLPPSKRSALGKKDNDFPQIPILFENDRILVIDKPHGVAHHSGRDVDEKGILAILRDQMNLDDDDADDNDNDDDDDDDDEYIELEDNTNDQENHSRNNTSNRLFGVHRLDKVTSGILVFAKDKEMAGLLSKAFREHKVTKYYTAISAKKPKKKKQGWVKGNMVPSRRGSWKLVDNGVHRIKKKNYDANDGNRKMENNYAATRFFTSGLGMINEISGKDQVYLPKTVMLFHPITGKTHQIRVAAKSVGLSILGDDRYENSNSAIHMIHEQPRTSPDTLTTIPWIQRTYLHATALHLNLEDIGLPMEGALTIVSKPPFTHLWMTSDNTSGGEDSQNEKSSTNVKNEFDKVLSNLISKHCECEPILNEWMKNEHFQHC